MYTQIILCLALMAMASARPQYHGYAGAYDHYGVHPAPVHDTPEVAHAKAAHFAAVAAAARAASHDGSDVDHSGAYVHDPTGDHAPVYVHDPRGDYAPAYNHYTKAGAYGGYSVAYHGGHYGATAVSGSYPYAAAPHVLHVPAQDTPEITAAKAAHFAAHAAAKGHHYG